MAKKQSPAKKEARRPEQGDGAPSASGKSTARQVKGKAAKLATNPLVAEVVAATLVAAAAALRDPNKARELAEAAADELGTARKQLADRGSALWQLATKVAQESTAALGADDASPEPKKATKPKKKSSKKKKK